LGGRSDYDSEQRLIAPPNLGMRALLFASYVLYATSGSATLIVAMNTTDGLAVCADNRVRRQNVDTDGHHKIRVAKNGIVMTMSGSASVEAQNTSDGTFRPIYSFYDESIDYLEQYKTADEVNWEELGAHLRTSFQNKVIRAIGGVPTWMKEFDAPGIKTIDELLFFYIGKDGKCYRIISIVDYREAAGKGQIEAFVTPAMGVNVAPRSLIMTFGRADVFNRMYNKDDPAFTFAKKERVLRDLATYKGNSAGLGYLTDNVHAVEALRYIIYITSNLGPNLVVSPTSDCGVFKTNGSFDLKMDLPPMTPAHLKFTSVRK